MKKKWVLIAILTILTKVGYTQIYDDFSNHDQSYERWSGDWNHFVINVNDQLQTKDDESHESALMVSSRASLEAEWSFWTRIDGGTSVYNLTRFYISESEDFMHSGFYVQIGGANKNVVLYKVTGSTSKKVIENSLRKGILEREDISVSVKLTRDEYGVFRLYSFVEDEDEDFVEEGTYFEECFNSQYCVLFAKYSKLRGRDMYFDDIQISGVEQYTPIQKHESGEINLLTESISINGDGYEDEMLVSYNFPLPGYRVTMNVYTADGMLIATPYDNVEINESGLLIWNGKSTIGKHVEIGVYIAILEFVHKNALVPIRKSFPIAVLYD